MSWEGELSDQEVSQMDQQDQPQHHHPRPATPPQEPPPPVPTSEEARLLVPLKKEAEEVEEDEENEMEGIQSVGPGSPQPMCTNVNETDADPDPQLFSPPLPPPAVISAVAATAPPSGTHPPGDGVIKTEAPWGDCPKTEPGVGIIRPAPVAAMTCSSGSASSSSSSGAGPSQPRSSFGEAFTGHTPLASPLTSRHPIRLPLATSG